MVRKLVIYILGTGKFSIYSEILRTLFICFLGTDDLTIYRGISIPGRGKFAIYGKWWGNLLSVTRAAVICLRRIGKFTIYIAMAGYDNTTSKTY